MAYVTQGDNDRAAATAALSSKSGALALAMALPKDLGGAGDGHNPEQLFALGWSSCFGQAILVLAKKHGLDGQAAKVTVRGDAQHQRRRVFARRRTQGFASRRRQGQASGADRRSPHDLPLFQGDAKVTSPSTLTVV